MSLRAQSEERIKELLALVREDGKRVLITGGFGFIGSHLVEEMQKHNIDYLSIDKRNPTNLIEPRVLQFDLCDKGKTSECIEDFRPDFLIHFGTNSSVDYYNHFMKSYKEDSQALINILETLSKLPNCRLVFLSSSYVYNGLKPDLPVTESTMVHPTHNTSPLQPHYNFGIAKLFFEQLILQSHKNSAVFRLSSVFGPGNVIYPNAIVSMSRECLETGQLPVWGSGSRMMQYIYNKDIVKYVDEAFFLPPGIYNLGGNEYLPVAVAAEQIADFFGARMVFLKDKQEGEALPFMETSKLKKASDKNHFTPFSEALKEYLNYFKGIKVLV